MPVPERLTIDVTVARDYLDRRRDRHSLAIELFELARHGAVELSTAPQGNRLDVTSDLAEQLQTMFACEEVAEAPQLAYPSTVTYPGPNLIPGAYVAGFAEAWDALVAGWRSHEGKPPGLGDRFHVETHVLQKRDVFLTDDRPLLLMCRRLSNEHGIPIVATGLMEYLESRS